MTLIALKRFVPKLFLLLEERGINVTYVGVTRAIVCHMIPLSQVYTQ